MEVSTPEKTKLEKDDSSQSGGNKLLPVFLKLESLRPLIVGGGAIGLEKLQTVIGNAPETIVKLVADKISDAVREFAAGRPNITLVEKRYSKDDLAQADLVIVAVNDIPLAEQIRDDAKSRGLLLNVADKPALCDFYLGSVVKKGNLKIGISTNGKSPTAAKRLKEIFQHSLPDELDETLENLNQIRNRLSGNLEDKVKKLNAITRSLVEKEKEEKEIRWKKIATYSVAAFGLMLVGHFIFSYIPLKYIGDGLVGFYDSLDDKFGWMVLVGFLAQLVDGALGMGYGLTSATLLLSFGVNAAAISGSIHTAEMFASGASGYSHYKFGNVNKKLFRALVIPGVIGAILGALLLVKFGDSHAQYIRPILATYTLILGVKFIFNAFRKRVASKKFKHYKALAGTGGFLDSFGGGGWGPIVTSTLINKGRTPRYVIGTVSLTEFFVTLASAFSFFLMIGVTHWQVILALILGGLVAAPLAAKLTGKMPRKTSFILLGTLVIIWSIRILVKSF